ncbi:MAG: 7-cyano-7-deazaguanine synthase QueC [Gammaproteobacteria bacterium]|nr:7-cyano-7-deazaguanine synthase QueC [Gammaproteobacteria bacterium]
MSLDAKNKKAVVLLSGGLDSATVLAVARSEGYECFALSFDYGQRHEAELRAAVNVAKAAGIKEHKVIKLDMQQFGGSALTDSNIAVPTSPSEGIPVTYVPARNTIFLSLALAWAEVLEAEHIFIGVNAVDYSGYPDCRPEYILAFQKMAALATKSGVHGRPIKIHVPLINLSKSQIIKLGTSLRVDYGLTVSCYSADADGKACGVCDSCRLRKEGFSKAAIQDPTSYI